MRKTWQVVRILTSKPKTDEGKAALKALEEGITIEEARQAHADIAASMKKYHGKLPRRLYTAQKKLQAILKAAKPAVEEGRILGLHDLPEHNPGAATRHDRMSEETKREVVLIENHTLHAVRVNTSTQPVSYVETVGKIKKDVRNLPKTTHLIYLFAIMKLVQEKHEELHFGQLDTDNSIRTVSLKMPMAEFCDYLNMHNHYDNVIEILRNLTVFRVFYKSARRVRVRGHKVLSWDQAFLWTHRVTEDERGKKYLTLVVDYHFVNDCVQNGFLVNLDKILRLKSDRAKLLAVKLMSDRKTFAPGVPEGYLLNLLGFSPNENIYDCRKKIRACLDDLVTNDLLAPYDDYSDVRRKVGTGEYRYVLSLPGISRATP